MVGGVKKGDAFQTSMVQMMSAPDIILAIMNTMNCYSTLTISKHNNASATYPSNEKNVNISKINQNLSENLVTVEWSNGRVQGLNPRMLRETAAVNYGKTSLQDEMKPMGFRKH